MVKIEEPRSFFLQPGYIFISTEPHLVHTVLGSCVAVCLWDRVKRFGGMCHYIYGQLFDDAMSSKYGQFAIPRLFRLMLEYGAARDDIKAHLVGGGDHAGMRSPVGEQNVALAEKLLSLYGVKVVTRDVRGCRGRKVVFNNQTGEIWIWHIDEIPESIADSGR